MLAMVFICGGHAVDCDDDADDGDGALVSVICSCPSRRRNSATRPSAASWRHARVSSVASRCPRDGPRTRGWRQETAATCGAAAAAAAEAAASDLASTTRRPAAWRWPAAAATCPPDVGGEAA